MALFGDSLLLDAIVIVSGLLLLAHLYFRHKFSYWEKRGVPFARPTTLFGNFKECFLQRESVGQFMQRMYNEGAGKRFFGIYVFGRPAIVLRDPELIKIILVKDFNIFYDRLVHSNTKTDPLSNNLFLLKGPAWKYLRFKMTPLFTPFRVKQMSPLIFTCAEQLREYLENNDKTKKIIEAKEVCGKFATDVITSCAFGIGSNCLLDPNAEFREFGRKIFDFSVYRSFEFMSTFMLPLVVKVMNVKFFSDETTKFLRKAFWDTIKEREEKNIERADFLQMLIQLKNNEKNEAKSKADKNGTRNDIADEMDAAIDFKGDILVAQAAIFFTAGFEANAAVIAFILYELAMQPHLQTRLREEILDAMDKNEGTLTYEAVRDMEYLHMVVSEVLRKYPPMPILDRVPNRDYVIPGTNITIEKGTAVYVPLLGLHMDPDVYPDPEHFDPERFSETNRTTRHPFMYLPFGEGPKNCIGRLFGLIAVKLGIASVIGKFEVSPCAETPRSMHLNPKAMVLAAKGGIPLKCTRLSD
ncbi:Cytochrome P450 6k1 [Zootermopsis nevadensis]|uniref:Cytochrome P450 6k1 n=2 Tax=Zootermopsis nevadensis TaxID=136037 RepID=A0A067QX98_ZOONE|nr:Cytochrome P450 6k1 [Zootermopsis nevadensis]